MTRTPILFVRILQTEYGAPLTLMSGMCRVLVENFTPLQRPPGFCPIFTFFHEKEKFQELNVDFFSILLILILINFLMLIVGFL